MTPQEKVDSGGGAQAAPGPVAGPRGHGVPAVGLAAKILVPLVLLLMLGGGTALAILTGVLPARRDQRGLEQRTAEAAERPARVMVVTATAAAAVRTVTLPARLEARAEAPLYPRETGYIESIKADIGDHVRAGQTLAVVNTPVLDQELLRSEADIHTAEARRAEAEAQVMISRSMVERLEAVGDVRAVSPQQVDDARGRLHADEAGQQAAAATLAAASADRKQLQERKVLANIVAPFDGEISTRGFDAGALAIADKTDTARAMFTLTDRSEIRAFIDLPQSVAVEVRSGQEVELRVRELQGRVFKGVVSRASASMANQTRTRMIESRIPNPDGLLLPGMFGEVVLSIPREPRPALVPGEAMLVRAGKTCLAVVGTDGRLSYREVVIGRDNGETVEVLSGVQPGERVAVSLARQPAEGAAVQAVERETK